MEKVLDKNSESLKITSKITDDGGLGGGLGNQLFGVATVLSFAKKYNMSPFFRFFGKDIYKFGNDYRKNLFKNLSFKNEEDCSNYKVIKDNYDVMDVGVQDTNILLEGYFQTAKNFDKHRDYILNLLHLSDEDKNFIDNYVNKLKIDSKKTVAMHIRRTDYISLGWILPLNYYKNALANFQDYKVIIFTDDPEYCKLEFPEYEICNTNSNLDYLDMFILSRMDACIMSNSTFCWWGVYIGNIKNVVAPFPWFSNPYYKYNSKIYSEEWHIINYI